MSNKDWLTTEKLVMILEKSLSKDSIVLHDQRLPNLNSSSNKKRQCDIVIKLGQPPRETITIVEVQKRNRKFDITTFDGLVQKMHDVGAQHLICVSTAGFTSGIKEKAIKLGGTVRLVKLSKIESAILPIFLNISFSETRPVYEIQPGAIMRAAGFENVKNELRQSLDDNILSFQPQVEESFSVKHLVTLYFHLNPPKNDGVYPLKFPYADMDLFTLYEDKFFPVTHFECKVKVTIHKYEIPLSDFYSYEQEESGPIAWLIEAKSTFDGNLIRLTLQPGPDNNYILNGLQYVQYGHKTNPLR